MSGDRGYGYLTEGEDGKTKKSKFLGWFGNKKQSQIDKARIAAGIMSNKGNLMSPRVQQLDDKDISPFTTVFKSYGKIAASLSGSLNAEEKLSAFNSHYYFVEKEGVVRSAGAGKCSEVTLVFNQTIASHIEGSAILFSLVVLSKSGDFFHSISFPKHETIEFVFVLCCSNVHMSVHVNKMDNHDKRVLFLEFQDALEVVDMLSVLNSSSAKINFKHRVHMSLQNLLKPNPLTTEVGLKFGDQTKEKGEQQTNKKGGHQTNEKGGHQTNKKENSENIEVLWPTGDNIRTLVDSLESIRNSLQRRLPKDPSSIGSGNSEGSDLVAISTDEQNKPIEPDSTLQ